jgi:ATPase subunit of ABC transporter with duplicated ATPase domains
MKYAHALAEYADAGGYDNEILWDVCCQAAVGMEYEKCKFRELKTLSGGQAKRLILEALLRGPDQVLLLDEPNNHLDLEAVSALSWALEDFKGTVIVASHDRDLLNNATNKIIAFEAAKPRVFEGNLEGYLAARATK